MGARSSGSSDESECGVEDFCGEVCLWSVLVARSVRADETEEEETLCAVWALDGGWVVRALDERRGDIACRAVTIAGLDKNGDQSVVDLSTA